MERKSGGQPTKKTEHSKPITIHRDLDSLRRAAVYSAAGCPIVVEYIYEDEIEGEWREVLRVFRIETQEDGGKTFRQATPKGSGWKLSTKGARLVPFRLRELRAGIGARSTIYIVEGEKDVLAIEAEGGVATCNPMGAGKDVSRYAEYFLKADLIRIVEDQDEAGRKHAQAWAETLAGVAQRVEVVRPVAGKDAHDVLCAGFSIENAFRTAGGLEDHQNETFRPYPMIRFSDIKPNFENNYLIKGLMDRNTLIVMHGKPGSGKSFIANEVCLSVGSGQSWRGCRVQKGRVLYIAAEGANGMQNRLYGASQHLALGPSESVDFHLVPSVVRLTEDEADVHRFVRTALDLPGGGVDLVVIDTLSRSMAGMDENTSKDMMAAVAAATRIMNELNCAVLIVHHSGKNAALGMRGSSSLQAAVDTELELKKDAAGTGTLHVRKQKEGEIGNQWMHRLESIPIGSDEDGDPITTAIVKPLDSAEVTAAIITNTSGKPSTLALDVVQVCIALNSMKKRDRVPDSIQAESGYKAFLQDEGWGLSLPVWGFRRRDVMELLIQRYQGADDEPPGSDGDATQAKGDKKRLQDKQRNWAKRRIKQATDRNTIVSHRDWIWLKESERNE